jgi:O-methyltransferase
MRYADQFYWSVDDSTLIGYQMPVSIVGLQPERYLPEPNSYWDYGLIWEYCPQAEVCVIGDSDEFVMLELRDKSVAWDHVVPGPPNKQEIAERMVTWVTPYQRHFLKFPLTLHDRDLPPTVEDARVKLRLFVDEVMSNTPPLPSHIKHSQWEYHWANFQDARQPSSRIRSWGKTRLQHAATVTSSITSPIGLALHKTFGAVRVVFHKTFEAVRVTFHKTFAAALRLTFHKTSGATLQVKGKTITLRVKRKAVEMCMPFAHVVGDRYVRPALRRFGLEIVKSTTLSAIQKEANEANWATKEVTRLEQQQREDQASIARLEQQQREDQASIARLEQQRKDQALITRLEQQQREDQASITRLTEKITDLGNIASEYQFKLERSYDYQAIMAQDQLRAGMSNLEPEFLALYEQCRQYTMTSWERLYALYKSVQYTVENRIPGDLVECGVWRGGSMKLVAHVLHSLGDTNRTLFLYDTFEGMTEPDPAVDIDFSGNEAVSDWREVQRRGVKWAYAPVEEVQQIIASSGYPMEKVKLVKGRVEETIPGTIPASIALLRLDTDWYSSTKHEMEHLYPKLSPQGILILDDYGHYQGARRGVDEYLSKLNKKPLLQRIDYSCCLAVKPTT